MPRRIEYIDDREFPKMSPQQRADYHDQFLPDEAKNAKFHYRNYFFFFIALAALGALLAGFAVWVSYGTVPPQPVCHAPAEDARIADCTYRDGGWYQD